MLWRAAAYLWPSSLVSLSGGLALPFGLLGLLFLSCGVIASLVRPDRWTGVFLLYGIGGGVHWGGAIGAPHAGLELSLFFAYLGLTAFGDAALLHLALIYPMGRRLARGPRIALYAPAGLAVLQAPLTRVIPGTILEAIAGLLLLVANLYSLAAGVVFLGRLLRVDPATRRAARLPLIGGGMIVASVVALFGAGGVLPGHPEAWNLALGVIPICLAIALVTHSMDAPPAGAVWPGPVAQG